MIRTPLKYLLRGAEGESDKNGLLEAECVKHTQKSANDKCISLVMSNRAEQRARARLSLSHLTKNAVILFILFYHGYVQQTFWCRYDFISLGYSLSILPRPSEMNFILGVKNDHKNIFFYLLCVCLYEVNQGKF